MRYVTVLLLFLLGSACVRQASPPPEASNRPQVVRSIAILPAGVMKEGGASLPSPQAVKKMEEGAVLLDQILTDAFAANAKVRLLSEEEVNVYSQNYSASLAVQALEVGKAVGAEAVMLWGLERYVERSGSDYGVETPSSVAFQFRLIHTISGQTLCAASFDETQQSASANLLDFKKSAKRGFKWVSASVLLREGVMKKIADCEYLKVTSAQEDGIYPDEEMASTDASATDVVATVAVPVESSPEPAPEDWPSEKIEVAPQIVAPPPALPLHPDVVQRGEIVQFIDQWRKAWEATAGPQGEIDHYGAFYAADFKNAKQDRNQWLSDKRRKNSGKDWIRLKISDLSITKLAEGSLREARFVQEYSSSNYSDTSQKVLVLRKNGSNWEIVTER